MLLISPLLRALLKRRNRRVVPVIAGEPTGLDIEEDIPFLVRNPNSVIFDVGANVGQSIDLFRRLFPSATIHAFEPSPDCLETLQTRQWGRNTFIHALALGDQQEERLFHQYELSVLNSLLPLDRNDKNQFSEVQEVGRTSVCTDTLDHVTEKLGVSSIDFLKIDTQGFDLRVLHGAASLLARNAIAAIMVELNYITMYEGQSSAIAIQTFLAERGFHLVDLYEKFRRGSGLAWCTAVFVRDR